MIVYFQTVCVATLFEDWMVDLPDDTPADELGERCMAELRGPNLHVQFIEQQATDEQDRELVEVRHAEASP